MSNLLDCEYRAELLRTDLSPRKLNEVSQKYKDLLLEELEKKIIKTEIVEQCQCGSQALDELAKIDRFGLPFGSLICQDCGLVTTSPRLKEESLPYYYEKFYHPLNYGKESLDEQACLFGENQGEKIFSFIEKYLPRQPTIKVLEIGSGVGNILQAFKNEAKSRGFVVDELGTEYSHDCIQQCNSRGVNVIYGDLKTVQLRNEKFDVIILSHVFEHFVNLKVELERVKQISHIDTLLYIEVPGVLTCHKHYYYDFSFLGYLTHAHMYNFTEDTLLTTCSRNGFESIVINEKVEGLFRQGESLLKHNCYEKILEYLGSFYFAYHLLEPVIQVIQLNLLKKEERIETRNRELKRKDTLLFKKDEMIKTCERELGKKDERIETRNRELKRKDTLLLKKDEMIKTCERELGKKDERIAVLDRESKKISELLSKKVKENDELESNVMVLEKMFCVRLVRKIRLFLRKMANR